MVTETKFMSEVDSFDAPSRLKQIAEKRVKPLLHHGIFYDKSLLNILSWCYLQGWFDALDK